MADGHIKISTAIDNEGAKKGFDELRDNIEKFGGESESKLNNELDKMIHQYEKFGAKLLQEQANIAAYRSEMEDLQAVINMYESGEIAKDDGYKKSVSSLSKVKALLGKSEQNADGLRIQMERITVKAGEQSQKLTKVSDSFKKASTSANGLGKAVNQGIGKLGRYALALFSIRSVYMGLQRLSNNWLNSDDKAAKQTKATIQGMTNALSNALAPAIQRITQLAAQALSVFASILKTLFGINISTKSTSKNTSGISSGLKDANKEAKKFLASFDEINKISSETDTGSSGTDDVGAMELPKVDDGVIVKAFENMKNALDPFVKTLQSINFGPLKKSASDLGSSFMDTFSIIGQSIANMMNNTVGPFLKLMAENIVPRAFVALQGIVDVLNPHLEWLLKNIIEPLFHWFMMDFVPAGFNTMIAVLELLKPVIDAVLDAFEKVWKEIWEPLFAFLGDVAVGTLQVLTDMINELTGKVEDNDTEFTSFLETLMRIGSYILVAIAIFKTVTSVIALLTTGATLVAKAFSFFLYIIGVVKGAIVAMMGTVSGMIALIALLVIAVIGIATNWEQTWQDIQTIVGNIKGVIGGLIDFIVGVFTGDWKRAWGGVVTAFSNIISGLANIFKFPFNAIIDGINFFIRQLNKIKIPDWVPGVGGKGINIGQIPRLQRGGVVNRPMQAMIGDGGKEAVIPLENDTRALQEIASLLGSYMGGGDGVIDNQIFIDGELLYQIMKKIERKKNNQSNGGLAYDF